jgi:hypothetical protein
LLEPVNQVYCTQKKNIACNKCRKLSKKEEMCLLWSANTNNNVHQEEPRLLSQETKRYEQRLSRNVPRTCKLQFQI